MRIFLIAFGALAVLVGGITILVRTRADDIGQDEPRTTKLDPDEQLHVPGQPAVDRDLPPLDVSEIREGVELIVADP